LKRWVLTGVSFGVVIAASVYTVRSSAPNGVDLSLPPLAHALALLAFAIDISCRSLKFTFTARAVGAKLHFFTAMRAGLGGDFGAAITPSRAGAEPARYLILRQGGLMGAPLLVVLYAELFFEMISLLIVSALMVLIFDASRAALLSLGGVLTGYCATIIGIGFVGWYLGRRKTGDVPPPWAERIHLTGARWHRVQRWVERFKHTVDSFKTMHRGWATASCSVSIAHVIARFTTLPILVLVASSEKVPIGPLVLWPFTLLYGGQMVPAPGGGGAVELGFRAMLGDTIPADTFAAALVWWRFYTFYLFIGLGALVAGNLVLRAIRERNSEA
jgi:uncharacterized protein (TIRG00374 family)